VVCHLVVCQLTEADAVRIPDCRKACSIPASDPTKKVQFGAGSTAHLGLRHDRGRCPGVRGATRRARAGTAPRGLMGASSGC
jgi:hypothetical protein